MEELQSFWEIPAVTHFCHVFRAAFNLIHFEIEELEQVILQKGNDPESYFSIDVLMVHLLRGCSDSEENISVENWEQHLQKLFNNCDREDSLIYNPETPFSYLPAHEKINFIFKLCELRLNANDVTDTIKDIPAESMQAKLVGKDSKNYFYWYFCGVRLYKESETKKLNSKRKEPLSQNLKKKDSKRLSENLMSFSGREQKVREIRKQKASKSSEYSWSVACNSLSDWESLAKLLSKSKSPLDKQLAHEIESKYLPMLPNIIAEAERLTRKRLIELAPKRTSSRISKVLAQKKLEEQAAEEKRQRKAEYDQQKQIEDEKDKRKREIEDRRKRASERNKAMEDRSKRAKQRQGRFYESEESETESTKVSSKSQAMHYKNSAVPSELDRRIQRPVMSRSAESCGDEDSPSDDVNEICNGQKSNSESISSDGDDDCSVQNGCVDDEPELKPSDSKKSDSENEGKRNVQSFIERRISSYYNKKSTTQHLPNGKQLHNSVGKLHIVNKSPEKSPPTVRVYRPENKFFRCRPYEGYRPPVYKPKNVLQPISLPTRNIRSFIKCTTSPSIIRFDFIKKDSHL